MKTLLENDDFNMNGPERNTNNAIAYILPLMAFLVIGMLNPDFSDIDPQDTAEYISGMTNRYMLLVIIQVVVAAGLISWFGKLYLKHFPLKISWLSVLVGIVGVVLWIGLCELQIEKACFQTLGLDFLISTRPAFDPFARLPDPNSRIVFLMLRFTLLAILVPIVEELFIRGWLVRWMKDLDWEKVNLRSLSTLALLTPSLYGVATHPSEAIAAFLWFGLVTWLMVRTGSLWDCVMAHAVTNLLLGIYVVSFSAWHLW